MGTKIESLGLRDRKKLATHRQLQAVALELFTDRGFDNVTIDDIAAACEVSRATVFRYFPTKEDLVVGGEPDRLEELRAAFERRPLDEPIFDSIRHALVAVAQRYEQDRGQLLAAQAIVVAHGSLLARVLELQAEWIDTFAALIRDRTLHEGTFGLRSRVLAGAVMAAMRVAIAQWLEPAEHDDFPTLISEVMDLLGDGFEHS